MTLTFIRALPFVPTLIALVVFVILMKLGFWQLQRAEQKAEYLQQLEQNNKTKVTEITADLFAAEAPVGGRFHLSGKVANDKLYYWDNRIVNGQVGYQVLVPVQTNLGWILLDLGWVKGNAQRGTLPGVDVPSVIEDELVALWLPKKNALIKETLDIKAPWPKLVQEVNVSLLSQHFAQPFLPRVAVKLEQSTKFITNYKPVVLPPEKHIAYAVQWFGLAIAVLVVFGFAVRKKHDNSSNSD
ncbi:MAG: hypothetical protein GJ680_10995 [Alteromonadaceae bacterium]|nr:hypothetical protein [Alteromonadaceae bacterium]